MLRILSREGAAPRVSGFFLNTAVQVVLLFRSDNWVKKTRIGKALGGVPGPGVKTADRTATVEETKREVYIHLGGDGTR